MTGLTHHEVTVFLLGIAILLGFARVLGELAQRLRQPAVVGEIIAGVVLGPTVFGSIAPSVQSSIFPMEGSVAVAMAGLSTLAISLFLLVAGMEIDLSSVWRQGKSVLYVGGMGILAPFIIGGVPALMAPEWFGATLEIKPVLFAAFFGTAMAITALPVIAKILMDMRMFQTDLAVTIISAAILNDLIGWIIFAFILGMIGMGDNGFSPGMTAVLTLAFAVVVLTAGRWGVNRVLPWVQAHSTWPSGVLAFAATLALLAAAFTEWIGVHAIFGAFLFGIAIGDSPHLRRRTRSTIEQFVGSIFAPLFFAGIGLKADFAAHFDLLLVLVVLVIATVGKVGACWLAAKWSGFDKRESMAIGFGMNARGAMEIVLGLLALEAGVISERLFVALVVMAIVTSMTSGVLMQRCFGKTKKVSFMNFASTRTFVADLGKNGETRAKAVERLALLAAKEAGVEPKLVLGPIMRQDRTFGSAIGSGISMPHTRIAGIQRPVVAIGLAKEGLDFDAADGQPVWIMIIVISPADDPALHLGVLASIGEAFSSQETASHAVAASDTLTELRAFLRIESSEE